MLNSLAEKRRYRLSLSDIYEQAGVGDRLEWATTIPVVLPDGNDPFPHQIKNINRALCFDRYGIFDEPGTGKTFSMQAVAMYYAGFGNKVVVVMPPALLIQFRESFHDTFPGFDAHFSLHILNQGPKERDRLFRSWESSGYPDFMLMSYELFSKLDSNGGIAYLLKQAGYSYLICDEAQNLKNPSSNRHKVVAWFLGDKRGRKGSDAGLLLATGTPTHNSLLDAYGLIKLITPGKYNSKRAFERVHCIYTMQSNGFHKLIGFRNKDALHRALYAQASRVTKDKVFSMIPPTLITVPVELHPGHKALYKKLLTERILEIGDKVISAVTAQSLRQKALRIVTTPHNFTDKPVRNAVLDAVSTLIDGIDIENREKVVMFCNYQDTVEFFARKFEHLGAVTLYGGTGNNQKSINAFLKDDKCRILVAHPRSGGVGLNLQSVCRYVIFVEPVSVPGDFRQAMERVYRPGQKRPVTVWIVKAVGTTSPYMIRNMLRKEGESAEVNLDRSELLKQLTGSV